MNITVQTYAVHSAIVLGDGTVYGTRCGAAGIAAYNTNGGRFRYRETAAEVTCKRCAKALAAK